MRPIGRFRSGDFPHAPNTAAAPQHGSSQAKKPRKGSRAKHGTFIPEGDDLLRGVDTKVLRSMHADMSGHKDVGKEFLILKAAIKWREGLNASQIASQMTESRSTVRDWLIRLRDRGLGGL